jgi:ParB family chromosome partitioning protein
MVAHAIIGSHLWTVRPEPQATRNDAVRESIETCRGETVFDERRRAVLDLLGHDVEDATVVRRFGTDGEVASLFRRLLDLPDPLVMEVIAVVIGETIASGSAAIEAAGQEIGVTMADWWQADGAFFTLLRDCEVLGRIVAEVAGEPVADANARETGKTLKRIVADHLAGHDGRPKVERWVPRWMQFPPSAYTMRGVVGTTEAAAKTADTGGTDGPDDTATITPFAEAA